MGGREGGRVEGGTWREGCRDGRKEDEWREEQREDRRIGMREKGRGWRGSGQDNGGGMGEGRRGAEEE